MPIYGFMIIKIHVNLNFLIFPVYFLHLHKPINLAIEI